MKKNENNIMYKKVYETIKELSTVMSFYIVSNCQNGYIELVIEKAGLKLFIHDYEYYGRTGYRRPENLQRIINRNKIEKSLYIGYPR
jgi:phosphoglycolate phosphatase